MTEISADEQIRRGLIGQIFAADRGRKCSEESMAAYLLAVRKMDTPRLARVVERLLDGFERGDSEVYRVPQPGTLWRLAKELRLGVTRAAPPPLELHGVPEQKQDAWDTAANLLLLGYVTDGWPAKVRGMRGVPMRDAGRYAPDSPYDAQKRCVSIGPVTKERTAILVKWKNAWARDMREDRDLYEGKLDGKQSWAECMARAEGEIDAILAHQVAA